MEIWKEVVGYEGLYKVSSIGNVVSMDRIIFNSMTKQKETRFINGKSKIPFFDKGYFRVCLYKNSIGKKFRSIKIKL